MNVTVYVPKDLEVEVKRRAIKARTTPARFIQVALRTILQEPSTKFSSKFRSLAGAWQDRRSSEEIIADIASHRRGGRRPTLR